MVENKSTQEYPQNRSIDGSKKSDDKFNHSSLNICNTFEQFLQINGRYQ
jgi:hypothetical protein